MFYKREFQFQPGGAVGRYSGCTEKVHESPIKSGALER